uniref:FLYWCH-type domain-containing protein n=1 Tax=Caenorhabditis tropicalis TaxID=1561998 RepID=A0A1I7V051_9PELO
MNTNSTASSSPSPPASSSLNAPTLPETPEVKLEIEDSDGAEPSSSNATIRTAPLPGTLDLAAVVRGNPALEALIANGTLGDNPSLAISQLFGGVKASPTPAAVPVQATEIKTSPKETGKRQRLKVFSNGYFMSFDKVSSCANKHFWRCEYKNTCKARMHTDINNEKIVVYIHDHNHKPPTNEEVRLYGLDPIGYERNRVYFVESVADPTQRRKIRKQVAEEEAAAKRLEQQKQDDLQRQKNAATIAAARAVYAQATSGVSNDIPTSSAVAAAALLQPSSLSSVAVPGQMNPNALLMAQLPFMRQGMGMNDLSVGVPSVQPTNFVAQNLAASFPSSLLIPKEESVSSSQPSLKRIAVESDDSDLKRDPMFQPTFEIARKLRKLWKAEPNRYPRTTNTPSTHFEFYISKKTDDEEHLYVSMRIEQRDEAHLREALQEFCGQNCIGMLLFGISPKISVMFNQPMISAWENNQFFLIDNSNPSRWRLMYVDDQTN